MTDIVIALATVISMGFLGLLGLLAYLIWYMREQISGKNAKELDIFMQFATNTLEVIKADNAFDKAQADTLRMNTEKYINDMQQELRKVASNQHLQEMAQIQEPEIELDELVVKREDGTPITLKHVY